mmetsp:Transcript_18353/g.26311  ORF Transcript_18353/g.26311 Transcript_18353/m.26311 type:complete len:224 (-) Transcript_18353:1083-1754(-)
MVHHPHIDTVRDNCRIVVCNIADDGTFHPISYQVWTYLMHCTYFHYEIQKRWILNDTFDWLSFFGLCTRLVVYSSMHLTLDLLRNVVVLDNHRIVACIDTAVGTFHPIVNHICIDERACCYHQHSMQTLMIRDVFVSLMPYYELCTMSVDERPKLIIHDHLHNRVERDNSHVLLCTVPTVETSHPNSNLLPLHSQKKNLYFSNANINQSQSNLTNLYDHFVIH